MSEDNLSARSTSTIDNYNELIEDDLQEEVPIPSPLRSTERFSAHESDRFGSIGFREAPKEGSIVYSDDDQDDDDKEVPSNNDHDEINNNQDDFEGMNFSHFPSSIPPQPRPFLDLVPMSTAANSLVNVFKKESRQKKKPAWGAGAGSKKKRAAYKISPPERTRVKENKGLSF